MNVFKRVAVLTVIAAGISVAMPSEASADYSVSVIRNDTNFNVGGAYRWGNGAWKSFYLQPGRSYATWLNRNGGSRPLYIRFDADPGPGRDTVSYRLRTYRNPTTIFQNGATERFIVRPNGRVDLVNLRQ